MREFETNCMKILEKIKKRSVLLGILFAMLLIGIVYAATSYQVNSGVQVTIDEWSVCKKVTNNNALAIFVPTNTEAEWTAFRTYASGVTYAECIYCDDTDDDGYGVCPNCNIDHGCTYDGDDCCDTDANAKPGQTAYFSSSNDCGSWDYNCSGAVEKHSNYCDKVTSCTLSNFSTLVCDEDARTLTSGGTNAYYACGQTATNACSYQRTYTASCQFSGTHLDGVGSITVHGDYSRIGGLCVFPPSVGATPGHKSCECH